MRRHQAQTACNCHCHWSALSLQLSHPQGATSSDPTLHFSTISDSIAYYVELSKQNQSHYTVIVV
jgi:hypothetical protein